MKVAVIGRTSNTIKPDYELKLSPTDLLILDGDVSGTHYEWVYEPLEKWAKERNIPYKVMYFYSFRHKPETLWYKEIVDECDKLVVYCDDKEDGITDLGLYAIEYAKELGKEVSIIKLPVMYHFIFHIKEWDNDCNGGFQILKDASMNYECARAEAIVEAQLRFVQYIHKWDSKYVFFLKLLEKKRYGYGQEWVEIDTREIERWYDSQKKIFINSI